VGGWRCLLVWCFSHLGRVGIIGTIYCKVYTSESMCLRMSRVFCSDTIYKIMFCTTVAVSTPPRTDAVETTTTGMAHITLDGVGVYVAL
jgi:hypothetical protein